MVADYRLFYVQDVTIRSGAGAEALEWFRDYRDLVRRFPGVKDTHAYATQFNLGDRAIQIWNEIEDYGVLDRWDDVDDDLTHEWLAFSKRSNDIVEFGQARLLGDWPGSSMYAEG